MQLLVSTANAADAVEALAGGADIIDAKNPEAGALGAVSVQTLQAIRATVGGARPVTAALGDATSESALQRDVGIFVSAGATLVKIGFAGIDSPRRARRLASAAVRGFRGDHGGVVLVAYADANDVGAIAPLALLEIAGSVGAKGVLLDTANKGGAGLCGLVLPRMLERWVRKAHEAALLVALAGKLTVHDLPMMSDLGADIAGVRGAACDAGRTGHVTADRVRLLKAQCSSRGITSTCDERASTGVIPS